MSEFRENKEMRILSAIGIILVAAGHLDFQVFHVGELFPYYSFHVFIFLFISGYFYREEAEKSLPSFLLHKVLTLLVPYYIWNVVYGLLAALLHHAGFSIGQNLSLYTLLIAPFDGGHQFMYQYPAWFVPALFLVELVNVCMRKLLSFFKLNNDWFLFCACLLLGIATTYLAIHGHVYGWYKIPGRVLFMLPGFQLGRIYQRKLEHLDTLKNGWYFLMVMGIQLLISVFCNGLAFGAVWVSGFTNGPVIPYLTVITGIAFWLRMARLLLRVPSFAKGLIILGRNTYSIMMHHIMGFFLLKTVFYLIYRLTPLCAEFDTALYFSDINYVFLPGGRECFKWLYLLVGMLFPLLLSTLQASVLTRLRKKRNKLS